MAVVWKVLGRLPMFEALVLLLSFEMEVPVSLEDGMARSALTRLADRGDGGYMGRGRRTGVAGWWSYRGTARA